jgi:two-component system response regulator AtoC
MSAARVHEKSTLSEAPVPAWFRQVGAAEDGFVLNVIDASGPTSWPLRRGACVVVGRGPEAGVHVECSMASRRHLALHVGAEVEIEDLGSSNGTTVAGERLAPHVRRNLRPGEVVFIGSTALVLRRMLLGKVCPTVVPRDKLLEGMGGPPAQGMGVAVVKLSLPDKIKAEWLASLLANVFGWQARLADWGDHSWRLAGILPDREACAAACRFAVTRLLACGLRVTSEEAFFPTAVEAGQARRHSIVSTQPGAAGPGAELIAGSAVMRELLALVDRIAPSDLAVLILGETGTGKELVATALHQRSPRAGRSFLRLNCATLNEQLLESELFGHEAGAFTGAKQQKRGLLEVSDGGTVFLDEVSELPLPVQAKLLRVVELRQFMRVGGTRVIPTDVRFVSATNRDLRNEVKRGRFREDLYFRLAGFTLLVPPLRDRPEDIRELARAFLARTGNRMGRSLRFSDLAMTRLGSYAWPGNVRELRNVVARASLLCDSGEILPHHLVFDISEPAAGAAAGSPASGGAAKAAFPFDDPVAAKESITRALASAAGNQTKAAKLLGISRRTLVNRLADFGMPRPRQRISRP